MASSFCSASSSSDSSPTPTPDGPSGSSYGGNGHAAGKCLCPRSCEASLTVDAASTLDPTPQPRARLEALASHPFPVRVELTVIFVSERDGSLIVKPYDVDALGFTTVGQHVQELIDCFSEKRKRERWGTSAIDNAYQANANNVEGPYAEYLLDLIDMAEEKKERKKTGREGSSTIPGEVTLVIPPPVFAAVPESESDDESEDDPMNGPLAAHGTTSANFSATLLNNLPHPSAAIQPAAVSDWNGSMVFRGRREHE